MDECEINQAYLVRGLQAQSPVIRTAEWQSVFNVAQSNCPHIAPAINTAAAAGAGVGASGSGCNHNDDNNPTGRGTRDSSTRVASNPYFCGYPGAPIGATRSPYSDKIGGCSWDAETALTKPEYCLNPINFRWVSYTTPPANSPVSCVSGACSGGHLCGTAQQPGTNKIIQGVCGTLLGYWSTSQICSINVNPSRTDLSIPPIPCIGLSQLYNCDQGIPTCYTMNIGTNCCGCVDWGKTQRTIDIKVGQGIDATQNAPYTMPCQNINPAWTSTVLRQIVWMKELCPSSYTYPFDDKSSSFICTSKEGNTNPGGTSINSVNYDLIFCPDSTTTRTNPNIPIKDPNSNYRIITFYNYCTYDVWPAFTGGSVSKDDCRANPSMCTKGSTCRDTETGPHYCFWDNPEPVSPGAYHLTSGASVAFHIPIQPDSDAYGDTKRIWSGAITGRTGCSTSPCSVGDCEGWSAGGIAGCKPARGFNQPATQAEFTLENIDHYDVEIINGKSVPMMVMPGVTVSEGAAP